MFDKIPKTIYEFCSLKYLSLAYNHLESIPDFISTLRFLEYLYLDGNNIKSLPTSLFNIRTLKRLSLPSTHMDDRTQQYLDVIMKEFKAYVKEKIPEKDQKYIIRYFDKVPKLYIITPPYKIGFFYEWSGNMLWARNDNALLNFGSPINPFDLPISFTYALKFKFLNRLWERINRKNSKYSSQDSILLLNETEELLKETRKELGPDFIIIDEFTK